MKEFVVPVSNVATFLSEERHFLEAIVRWNYFPNQKNSSSELPPCFSTARFTPEVAEKLAGGVALSKVRRKSQFDLVEYRATRYNNVPRVLGLIHPLAYSNIFVAIKENREEIIACMEDDSSAIRAENHNDGRLFIMNYDDHETKTKCALDKSFGAMFRAHADIANCFGSVYTHSLEWAVQGYDAAKQRISQGGNGDTHWSTKFDQVIRGARRNETSGLPIGPASSSIAVEVILAAVDRELAKKYKFIRYIDDYTAYCETHSEAQDFIRALSNELARYRLSLNLTKTNIVELPLPIQDAWISSISNALPTRTDGDGVLDLSAHEAINFLDYAVFLNKEVPDGSVLKYAVGQICHRAKDAVAAAVFGYVLNLSWHFPILLPYLEKIDARSTSYDVDELAGKLNKIIEINAYHRRSDGMCWALYYLKQIGQLPSEEAARGVISSGDCVSITMLCLFENSIDAAVVYANGVIGEGSTYELDRNWLLLYQLFADGRIDNPYPDEDTFGVLKKYDVRFLCPPATPSHAENYCFVLSNPFEEEEVKVDFDQYMNENGVRG